MKGYLKKWTNYTSGYKLRWFVLEDGVLSYYKHQDDAGSACRGAINMRIATLHMDPRDKLGFDIHGKSSVKYSLKANHQAEAKRWFWALNNAIQWSKDEAREEQRRSQNEPSRQSRSIQIERAPSSERDPNSTLTPGTLPATHLSSSPRAGSTDFEGSTYAPSTAGEDANHMLSRANTVPYDRDLDDEEDLADDASGHEVRPNNRDAFNITAQSAKLQLDLLTQVSAALQIRKTESPSLPLSDPTVEDALTSYDTAVKNLRGLMLDLLRISRDHEAFWQYRLEREANVRRLWEESMARVAQEQEELQGRIGESEEKRKRTKRALRDALEGQPSATPGSRSRATTQDPAKIEKAIESIELNDDGKADLSGPKRKMTIQSYTNNEISDDDSDAEDQFFDAVDAGEVEMLPEMPMSPAKQPAVESVDANMSQKKNEKASEIQKSFRGYEDGVRKRLKLDADNRPKASLWVSKPLLYRYT